MCNKPPRSAWLLALLLYLPSQSSAQTIILSADANMISALDPGLTSRSVSSLAVRPTGMEEFLINILQGGNSVFIDQYAGHSNRGVVGGYEQLFNYYNSLPGISVTMPGGDFTSADLAGKDLLISSVPNTAYTVGELQAISDFLGNGGTVFFLGGEGQNFTGSTSFINDALSFLGSGLALVDTFIAVPGWPFYTSSVNTSHPLMLNVPNLSVAVSGSVSGGESLAFYIHSDGIEYTVLAVEGGDPDSDGDGIPDDEDICPGGDDNLDDDADGVPDFCDVCPLGDDGVDYDNDGVADACDACPMDADNDADGDGVCGDVDICPGADDTLDMDFDSYPDACDVCPADPANDADADGFCANDDNCPDIFNTDQTDTDGDGIGDACEPDNDGDGVVDDLDNCPYHANSDQSDLDGDGIGDACDDDSDNDGVLDSADLCPGTTIGDVVGADGCAIAQLCPCEHPNGGTKWKNHGAYVRCVAHTSNYFLDLGLITETEKDAIVSAAGSSSCGHKK